MRIVLSAISLLLDATIAHSLIAFAGLRFLRSSIEKCKMGEPYCVATYFERAGKMEGLAGEVVLGADGSGQRNFGINLIDNDSFDWVVPVIK